MHYFVGVALGTSGYAAGGVSAHNPLLEYIVMLEADLQRTTRADKIGQNTLDTLENFSRYYGLHCFTTARAAQRL